MSLSINYPALVPTLNLDFASSKSLDARVTFVRTTTATYYDGITTAKAEENLLLQSQDFTTTWAATNATIVGGVTAPDGTATASTFTFSGAGADQRVIQSVIFTVGASYTFSVFLKGVAGETVTIESDASATSVTLTASWARYSVTGNAQNANAPVRIISRSGNTATVFDVWGAQLEQRSAVTAYTATTTEPITNYIPVLLRAPAGVARFDHNPTTDDSLGLLIEEQRTNLLVRSEEFENASWTKTNSSVTGNTIVAPDGTLTGDKLVEDTANSTHETSQLISVTSGTMYTYSVYAKAAERTSLALRMNPAGYGALVTASFNLSAQTATVVTAGTSTSARITPVGNSWFRCSITSQATATASTGHVIYLENPANTRVYTGNGYDGVYLWGAQLEAGAFPTSYIPTVASTVTRNRDAASMTGTNFSSWYRPDEGTLFSEASRPFVVPSGQFPRVFEINDGTTNDNTIRNSYQTASAASLVVVNSTVNQAALNPASSVALRKLAGVYKVDDFAASVNGGSVSTDTSGTLPVVRQANIGSTATGTSVLNGHIRKLAYYNARLTNAQLQALTTV